MEWVSESTNDSFNSNNNHTIIQAIVITIRYILCRWSDSIFIMKIENCGEHTVWEQ